MGQHRRHACAGQRVRLVAGFLETQTHFSQMNSKQIALLLFLLVVLGLGGLLVYNKQNDYRSSGDPSIGRKLLAQLAVNDVAHIALKEGTNELNLVKKKDDIWRVRERNDYPANYNDISDFLLKAHDLKVVQSEKAGPADMTRLALVPGQGTNAALVAEFKDQSDKTLQTLLLGKKHMQKSRRPAPFGDMGDPGWPDGRYIRIGADSDSVALISEPLANIEPKPEQWLNKDFFKVEKVRAIDVASPTATNSWKVTRDTETAEWKLADAKPGEQLDSTKTSSLSNPLSSPSFSDVAPESKAGELGLAKPTVVKLDTFDDFSYTLKVGVKTNDNYPVELNVSAQIPKERTAGKDEKPEDKTKLDKEFKEKQQKLEEKLAQEKGYEKWVYLVSSWTLDPLLKDRGHLLVEKKAEAKKDDKPAADAAAPPPGPLPTELTVPAGTNDAPEE
jgi:hypothetical protein